MEETRVPECTGPRDRDYRTVGRSAYAVGCDDQPVRRRVSGSTSRQYQRGLRGLVENIAGAIGGDNENLCDAVDVCAVRRPKRYLVAYRDPVQVVEGMQVGRAMSGDPHATRCIPRIRGAGVVARPLFQRVRVDSLDDDHVQTDLWDLKLGVGVARKGSRDGNDRPPGIFVKARSKLDLGLRRLDARSPKEPSRVPGHTGGQHQKGDAYPAKHPTRSRALPNQVRFKHPHKVSSRGPNQPRLRVCAPT
jgi:hypothetical protein